ncbi:MULTISPECIES: D-2-hydroxyacid dehydrogenase [Halolamina]|uniref:Phosphoglycerate dehydrogenase n=1 Tax=Halolamina pelagica TaxID=699431 RepID=A0A1I5LYS3_9EURY|nr:MULTISPECIES: D-2-hydroxyacid dehydrogenase [Halolamina]NHX35774.1 D-2-hydroxyacid dehydrogenase [Halolamina sp. R1-12]SFP02425.1 Phosphoglycerate dehydrogenase [Halolamina pelagica]
MSEPDILLLRQKIHGLSVDNYADAMRERLPDAEVAVAETPEQEHELITHARIVAGFTIDDDLLDRAENLELFACSFAGTGHLPMNALEEAGVAVTNASGVHGPNISEYVIGALISLARDFPRAARQQEEHVWQSYGSRELQGSTVTVVGLGAIGQAVVERLEPFGVDTIGVRYTPEKGGPTDEVLGFDEIHDALRRTDAVVLACPLTDATRNLLDDEAFKTLPPHAHLVNVARGGVVDTDALVNALRSNDIDAAFLDVTDPEPLPADHPLWGFDNVRITPHNAGHSPEYFERLAAIVAANYEALQDGDAIENRVV